jgi:hypothetical protein
VLTLHTVWSISVPIALVEALAGERRETPWLGNIGLAVTAVLFGLGIAGMTSFSIATTHFVASAPQLIATVVIVALLVALAFVLPRPAITPVEGRAVPNRWLVGVGALIISGAFKAGLSRDWPPGCTCSVCWFWRGWPSGRSCTGRARPTGARRTVSDWRAARC